jgi:ABC-type uncharacterized transport system substrate-binding protein
MKTVCLILISTLLLFAHPHTFIDVHPTLKEESITLRWVFDEMTSQILMMDFDTDHDMVLSAEESQRIYTNNFASLKSFGYYTYLYRGKTKLPTSEAHSFRASAQDGRVAFVFTLPLPKGVDRIMFYDEEMFSAFVLKEAFIKNTDPRKQFRLKELDGDFYFGYILELQ